MPAQTVIQLRRDTAANWTSTNPTLAAGEAGLETDSGLVKFGNGTLAWDALPYGSSASIRTRVLNQTGSPITKGSVVYISGASGDNPTITLADADTEATSSKTLGLVDSTIANGAIGYVVEAGLITGLNTSTATAGQSVWLSSTAGQFVYGAPPAKPAHSVYLGVVIRAQLNNGAILVKVQNGYELNELHDVNIDGTPADNEVLAYNLATNQWINQTASEAGLEPTVTGAATTITSSNLTIDRALVSNASGKVAVSSVTSTELGRLSGVTSAVQTQIDSKQATITGAATTITGSNLTASRALTSDASGKVAVSSVTNTELGYLSGVTSAIQTQINSKAATLSELDDVTLTTPLSNGQTLVYDTGTSKWVNGAAAATGETISSFLLMGA